MYRGARRLELFSSRSDCYQSLSSISINQRPELFVGMYVPGSA